MSVQDKAAEVVKHLSESHWTSSCIVTMNKFISMCGGPDQVSVVLSHLSGCSTAQYLSTSKKEFIEVFDISFCYFLKYHIFVLN